MDHEISNQVQVSSSGIGPEGGLAAESITIEDASVDNITAQTVTVNQGNIGRVQAFDVSVHDGGIARAEADQIQVVDGGIGLAQATYVSLSDGAASVVVAQHADLQNSSVAVLLARSVSGDARVLIDMRAGAALGLAFGLTVTASSCSWNGAGLESWTRPHFFQQVYLLVRQIPAAGLPVTGKSPPCWAIRAQPARWVGRLTPWLKPRPLRCRGTA